MSVLENVTFGPIHSLHVSKQEAAKTGMEHLEQVGLADKANAKPWELSGDKNRGSHSESAEYASRYYSV